VVPVAGTGFCAALYNWHVHPCNELCQSLFQERDEDTHPAANQALWDSIMDGSKVDGVFPEIFHFEQKIILHMGEQPYHPANRRVALWVRLEDLKMKYGLSDDAIIHIVTVRILQLLLHVSGAAGVTDSNTRY
jgi:hypothetical protein